MEGGRGEDWERKCFLLECPSKGERGPSRRRKR